MILKVLACLGSWVFLARGFGFARASSLFAG